MLKITKAGDVPACVPQTTAKKAFDEARALLAEEPGAKFAFVRVLFDKSNDKPHYTMITLNSHEGAEALVELSTTGLNRDLRATYAFDVRTCAIVASAEWKQSDESTG
jgi:hypothetical protein